MTKVREDSYIVYSKSRQEATSYVGPDATQLFRVNMLKASIRLWTKTGMMPTRGWTKIYVSYRTQVDVDWENDPVHEETILWSCWREPMPWSDNAMEEF
jgi:hypothetical protein